MANKNPYSTYRQQSWIIIPTLLADCFRTQKCSQHVSMSKIKLTFLSSYFRVIISPFQFPLLVCFCCMANRTWFFLWFFASQLRSKMNFSTSIIYPKKLLGSCSFRISIPCGVDRRGDEFIDNRHTDIHIELHILLLPHFICI